MTRRVLVLDEAEAELFAAEAWFEARRPGLGPAFRQAIDDAMGRLTMAPQRASPVVTVPKEIGARAVRVKKFPYSIVFLEVDDILWVVAFAHHRRRPGYWRARLL